MMYTVHVKSDKTNFTIHHVDILTMFCNHAKRNTSILVSSRDGDMKQIEIPYNGSITIESEE